MNWLDALAALRAAGADCVLVTVLRARGSTPREAGCKMVVTADAVHDSIGGGALEWQAIAEARNLLVNGADTPLLRDMTLGPALHQCCGGQVSLLLEPLRAPLLHVALFGAGHVGRALVRLLGDLPCQVTWIDERADAFPDILPANTGRVVAPDPAACVAGLPPGARMVVMTHSHALDYALVAAALRRDDLGSVGLIGSDTKAARFTNRLQREGLPLRRIARLECPIGLPGLTGKRPAEIALSIAARLFSAAAGHQASVMIPDRESRTA